MFLLHGWTVTAALNWFRVYEPLSRWVRVVSLRPSRARQRHPYPAPVPAGGRGRRRGRAGRCVGRRRVRRRRLLDGWAHRAAHLAPPSRPGVGDGAERDVRAIVTPPDAAGRPARGGIGRTQHPAAVPPPPGRPPEPGIRGGRRKRPHRSATVVRRRGSIRFGADDPRGRGCDRPVRQHRVAG